MLNAKKKDKLRKKKVERVNEPTNEGNRAYYNGR